MQAPTSRQEAREVPLGQIEVTLARLGRELNSAQNTTNQMAARSSVMTLVAYSEGIEQTTRVSRAIEGLTAQIPSRAIILSVLPDMPGTQPLSASVALRCQTPHAGSNPVCAEQIIIEARDDVSKHLSGVVLPLLLAELPVFVWWTGGLPNGELVHNLLESSDRTIVDSCDFANPTQDFAAFADLVRSEANRTAFSDFNWTRLRAWRELTAQFFDTARFRPYLNGVEHIEVEYAVEEGQVPNPIQAYLFAGWLASRLQWQTWTGLHQDNGKHRIGLHTYQGSPITMELTPRIVSSVHDFWASSSAQWDLHEPSNNFNEEHFASQVPTVGNGALMRVNVQSRLGGNPATFTVLREDDMKNATTVVVAEGETVPQRRSPLDTLGEATLLSQQLGIFGHDPVFDSAVMAAKIMVTNDGNRARRAS